MKAKYDWATARTHLRGNLSDDDRRLLDLLAEGKSTPEIAAILGQHRSLVWRRAERLKGQSTGDAGK